MQILHNQEKLSIFFSLPNLLNKILIIYYSYIILTLCREKQSKAAANNPALLCFSLFNSHFFDNDNRLPGISFNRYPQGIGAPELPVASIDLPISIIFVVC